MGLFGGKRLATGLVLEFIDSRLRMDIFDGVEESDMSRAAVDVTPLAVASPEGPDVGNREFLFGKLVDAGRWSFEVFHDPNQPLDSLLHRDPESIRMTLPKGPGEAEAPTVDAFGGVVELSATYRKEEAIMRRVTVKLSGKKSQTPATRA